MVRNALIVANDRLEIIALLSAYLADEGYSVNTALEPAGSLRWLMMNNQNLIFVEHQMLMRYGFQIADSIRKLTASPIILVGCACDEVALVAQLEQFNGCLTEPFSQESVRSVLDQLDHKAGENDLM